MLRLNESKQKSIKLQYCNLITTEIKKPFELELAFLKIRLTDSGSFREKNLRISCNCKLVKK
jgi:hypothetical protein